MVNLIISYRFRSLVEYYKTHYDGLEFDIEAELKIYKVTFNPCHVKTCLQGFQPGSTQTELYSHRRWLEA